MSLLTFPDRATPEKGDDPIDALAFLLAEVAGFDWREINKLELVSLRTIATFSSAAARERITEMRRA